VESQWYPNYVVCALERFATFGSRTALTQQNRSLTYTEARQLVLDLAARLRALDVRSGSVVGVFMGLRIESPLLQLALHLVGARSVWVDVTVDRLTADWRIVHSSGARHWPAHSRCQRKPHNLRLWPARVR